MITQEETDEIKNLNDIIVNHRTFGWISKKGLIEIGFSEQRIWNDVAIFIFKYQEAFSVYGITSNVFEGRIYYIAMKLELLNSDFSPK